MRKISRSLRIALVLIICLPLLGRSDLQSADMEMSIRAFTRSIEFNFIAWEANSIGIKIEQAALNLSGFISGSNQYVIVKDYLSLLNQSEQLNSQVTQIYSDPSVQNPDAASQSLEKKLAPVTQQLQQVTPLAESILQNQVSAVAAQMGVTLGGEPFPPVAYQSSDTPLALIISPRNSIKEIADISLIPSLTVSEQEKLEDEISQKLNVSALVVPIGGIGLYPTMVMNTTDLNWLTTTIAHEWTHNFLTFRPLGISYDVSENLRDINETVASLVGREIGTQVIAQYYPDLVQAPATASQSSSNSSSTSSAPVFNFNAEMHTTRVTTDQLLAAGKISEAESYMESRRAFFWQNGYQIRKLNQAYFAFYGAYNDVGGNPSGAAGSDPVGPAVAALRAKYQTLGQFLNAVSWMTSLQQLENAAK